MAKISILGSGGWGTALAVCFNNAGHDIVLWSAFSEEIETLKRDKEHKKLLPGVHIDEKILITDDIGNISDSDVIILAVPSFALKHTSEKIKGLIGNSVIINVSKGIDEETLCGPTEVIESALGTERVVTLSGPSHAEEVARGVPTSLVAASKNKNSAELVQDLLMNPSLRIYTNDDVVGVELGGALKNVIALAAGIADGLGLGDNTKAALMTRGLSEIARLGIAMGARKETFAGLTGIGDLIVTCTSMHSRNRRFGILVGKGMAPADALQKVGMTVEGYRATLIAHRLAHKYKVEMPIVEQCYGVLYKGRPANAVWKMLMQRPKKHEQENIWID